MTNLIKVLLFVPHCFLLSKTKWAFVRVAVLLSNIFCNAQTPLHFLFVLKNWSFCLHELLSLVVFLQTQASVLERAASSTLKCFSTRKRVLVSSKLTIPNLGKQLVHCETSTLCFANFLCILVTVQSNVCCKPKTQTIFEKEHSDKGILLLTPFV